MTAVMSRPADPGEVRRCLAALVLIGVWSQHARVHTDLDLAKQLKALQALDAVGEREVPAALFLQVSTAVAEHGGRLANNLLEERG